MTRYMTEEQFSELCESVRAKNPKRTCVVPFFETEFPQNYGCRLGNALLDNTYVSTIALNINHGHIDTPTSTINEETIAPILQFLREGTSLCNVHIVGTTQAYVGYCLRAMAMNAKITDVFLGKAMVPLNAMAFFLGNTPSLRFLEMPLSTDETLVNALKENHTVEKILWHGSHTPRSPTDETALSQFASTHRLQDDAILAPLEQLCPQLNHPASIVGALGTTSSLKSINLDGRIDLKLTKCLVNALWHNKSLDCLSFCDYEFDTDAAEAFVSYLKTNHEKGNELSFKLEIFDHGVTSIVRSFTSATLQVLPGLRWFPSNYDCVLQFWQSLEQVASKCRMPSLEIILNCTESTSRIRDAPEKLYKVVCQSLPQLAHLRTFEPFSPWMKNCPFGNASFLRAFYENGSVHNVIDSVEVDSWREQRKCEYTQFAKVACQRNQFLPSLLLSLLTAEDGHTENGQADDVECGSTKLDHYSKRQKVSSSEEQWISLYPTLFSVAQQSTRLAPNWILTGLLALSVGKIG